jgi:GxxExxY protein
VYNQTSRTFPEFLYERAMIEELRLRELAAVQQDEYTIYYKERIVGEQRLDLFVVQEVVVENKVAERLTALHRAQCASYLKTVGLVFNFGSDSPAFERVYMDPARVKPTPATPPPQDASEDRLYPDLSYAILGALFEVHSIIGPGFVHRIYGNACHHELTLRGLAAIPAKRIQVAYKNIVLGDIAFGHLTVEGKVMVFPAAYRDASVIHYDTLKYWMRLSGIRLGILANFNATRLQLVFVRA